MTVGELREILHTLDNDKDVVVGKGVYKDFTHIKEGINLFNAKDGYNYVLLVIENNKE